MCIQEIGILQLNNLENMSFVFTFAEWHLSERVPFWYIEMSLERNSLGFIL